MRRMIALVLFVILLYGCSAKPAAEPPMEGWTPVGDAGNLWAVPAQTDGVRQLLKSPEGLVLVRSGGDGLDLTLLSEEDLSVTAETTVDAGDQAYVQVLDDYVSIADPGSEAVTLLSPTLEPVTVLELSEPANAWFLSPDAGTLYAVSGSALLSCPLPTGELQSFPDIRRYSLLGSTAPRTLLEGLRLSPIYLTLDRAVLACVGAEGDLLTRWYSLDLRIGAVEALDEARMIALQEGMKPQPNGGYIREDRQSVTWYDDHGQFRSTAALASDNSRAGQDFVWSEAHSGWFFLEYLEGTGRLLFWDPAVPSTGEDLDIAPDPVLEGTILPAELYERAAELSERFDLDIRIGDRCLRGYKTYDSAVLTDPELTSHALDVLEQVLSRYPEGFFTQLKYGNRHTVRIELVDALSPVAGKDVSSGASAVTFRLDRCCVIALNAHKIRPSAIFHEFSHIIDDRMRWEALFREDALYSEEGWMALQPEGFEFAGSYQQIPDSVKQFYDSGWFATNYGCVSATEDRAVTMEHACTGQRSLFEDNPHLMAKLRYYCACIRDSFNTEGWPEITPWEQFLK